MRANTHDAGEAVIPGEECPLEGQLVFEAMTHEIMDEPKGEPDMQQMNHTSKKPSGKVSFASHPHSGEVNIGNILSQYSRGVSEVSNHETLVPRGEWEVYVHNIGPPEGENGQDMLPLNERLQEQLSLHPIRL